MDLIIKEAVNPLGRPKKKSTSKAKPKPKAKAKVKKSIKTSAKAKALIIPKKRGKKMAVKTATNKKKTTTKRKSNPTNPPKGRNKADMAFFKRHGFWPDEDASTIKPRKSRAKGAHKSVKAKGSTSKAKKSTSKAKGKVKLGTFTVSNKGKGKKRSKLIAKGTYKKGKPITIKLNPANPPIIPLLGVTALSAGGGFALDLVAKKLINLISMKMVDPQTKKLDEDHYIIFKDGAFYAESISSYDKHKYGTIVQTLPKGSYNPDLDQITKYYNHVKTFQIIFGALEVGLGLWMNRSNKETVQHVGLGAAFFGYKNIFEGLFSKFVKQDVDEWAAPAGFKSEKIYFAQTIAGPPPDTSFAQSLKSTLDIIGQTAADQKATTQGEPMLGGTFWAHNGESPLLGEPMLGEGIHYQRPTFHGEAPLMGSDEVDQLLRSFEMKDLDRLQGEAEKNIDDMDALIKKSLSGEDEDDFNFEGEPYDDEIDDFGDLTVVSGPPSI